MSFFSTALKSRAESRHLNQADIARLSGVSRSYVSRLIGGESYDMSEENFRGIVNVFADPQTQAEIIAARCQDTVEVARAARIPGAELVEITVKSREAKAGSAVPTVPAVQLSAQTERAFAWLRDQCPLNPNLEKHLVGYAQLMGMQ